MTVSDLKKMLERYPDDMEIVNQRCSDYEIISEDEWTVIKAVDRGQGWVMRSHPTMSEENKANEKEYLHLMGN